MSHKHTHPNLHQVSRSCKVGTADKLCEELVVYYFVNASHFPTTVAQGLPVLGSDTFEFSVTDEFMCCAGELDAERFPVFEQGDIGSTRTSLKLKYGVSTAKYTKAAEDMTYATEATSSSSAKVTLTINNGLATSDGTSAVLQTVPSQKQPVLLEARDYKNKTGTSAGGVDEFDGPVSMWITSLPSKVRPRALTPGGGSGAVVVVVVVTVVIVMVAVVVVVVVVV